MSEEEKKAAEESAEDQTAKAAEETAETEAIEESTELTAKEKRTAKALLATLITVIVLFFVAGGLLSYNYYFKKQITEKMFKKQVAAVEAGTSAKNGVDIDITQKYYVHWITELKASPEKYLGKTVRLSGAFAITNSNGKKYYHVYRTGPGDEPGETMNYGIELLNSDKLPTDGDWVEVTGTLATYDEGENSFLYLKNPTITVLAEKGVGTLAE